jgi:NAD-dependent deacetylase
MTINLQITQAATLLARARVIVCLTGAGVSAESGVATFRDALTGHWATFDPQQLASPQGFAADPGLVWRWYMARLTQLAQVRPNPGHLALAELARRVPSFTLFTQNVDDLHERAGSTPVQHLHGTIAGFHCNECGVDHPLSDQERTSEQPPCCTHCGGLVRPSVVWFGELLPAAVLERAWRAVAACDVMLVVGTSGVVYPAAQLPFTAKAHGAAVIAINPEPTPISAIADCFLCGPSGVILPQVVAEMR